MGIALLAAGYVLGFFTHRNDWPPLSTYNRVKEPGGYFADLSAKTETPCPASGPRTAVVLALGQSNASNRSIDGEGRVRGTAGVVNFFDGKCYQAEDPLLGSDGVGNSIWTLVANQLVVSQAFDKVVLVSFAIGDTTIRDWAEKEYFQRRLGRIASDLRYSGLSPTTIVWFQGETDSRAKTTRDDYVAWFTSFLQSLRSRGLSAPVYVSLTTVCQSPSYPAVRAAQQALQSLEGIRPGPDTDTLGYAYRWDGCHFTSEGRAAAARLWADALLRDAAQSSRRVSLPGKPGDRLVASNR